MFSPQTDDSTLQELKRYYDAVMPMTNPAMYHNPHTPAAKSQRGKLKSEWKCTLSSRIFQLFPSIKTGFFLMTKYMEMAARDSIHWKPKQSTANVTSDDQNIQMFWFKPPPQNTCLNLCLQEAETS